MKNNRLDLVHDLVMPMLLFAALGGMTWAVRGSSGFGTEKGCLFAGVMWGAAWWYLAHDPSREQSRRYASGWIILAVTLGIGLAGAQGWMQWPSFFEGKLLTNWEKRQWVPVPRMYGFLWLFIAGVPWAGLGACALAWCGSLPETRVWHWFLRIGCGLGVALLVQHFYNTFPQYFLPLYDSLGSRYQRVMAVADREDALDPNLWKLVRDCREALYHLGFYVGFLLYEIGRRDWKNALLIVTVGVVNGTGWALCQNWKWAPGIWGAGNFNWWRCWESSGGISIGIAFGLAYFLVNRRMSDKERAIVASRPAVSGPNFEWLLIYGGLAWFLSLYLATQLPRGTNIPPVLMSYLTPTIRNDLSWRGIYFTVVLAFGTAYYLLYRGRPSEGGVGAVFTSLITGIMALVFIGALIAGLFVPQEMLTGRVVRSLGLTDLIGRGRSAQMSLSMIYLGVVMTFGLFCYLVRYRSFTGEKEWSTQIEGDPNIERWGLYLGLVTGLGFSLLNGMRGWYMVYKEVDGHWASRFWDYLGVNEPDERLANSLLWQHLGTVYLICLLIFALWILSRPRPRSDRGNLFPNAYGVVWLVLVFQNVIAQFITGPLTEWKEMAFNIYYVLLFAITAVIVIHYHLVKVYQARFASSPTAPPAGSAGATCKTSSS